MTATTMPGPIRQYGDVWAIDTGGTTFTLRCVEGAAPALIRIAPSSWAEELPQGPMFTLRTDIGDLEDALTVAGSPSAASVGATTTLRVPMASPDDHRAALVLEAIEDQAIIRVWLEITPASEIRIDRVEPLRLALPSDAFASLATVSGIQQQGHWRPDSGPYRAFRLEHASLGEPQVRESGWRSTWDGTPWAAFQRTDGKGSVLFALEYGARWELRTDPAPDSIDAAFAPVGIAPVVEGGETWVSPPIWIGVADGDLDDAAAVMHRYIRTSVLSPSDQHFPWVQYNTWFSWYCDLDAEELLREADIAADLGVEVFYVDAGWWAGNPRRRDRFSTGLGIWTENRDKFPDGLAAFADAIRARGMHFGIWVEPERVDLRTATTATWDPDWIARMADGTYVRCDWPADTETAWLCYGHPDAQAWAERWIGDLVASLGVRWLKWDSNYWDVCHGADHGHGATDGERAQVEGVHAVMARLRQRFPDLVIENCAGGATRMDFAITRQTHAAWLHDSSEPSHRSRFHNAGASYLFPPAMLNAWVTESEHENVNGQDQPDHVWRAVLRSRMIGAMGISCRLQTWTDRTRDIAREEIARYRAEIRPLLQSGTFRHLLPQPLIESRHLPTPDTWEAYQMSSQSRDHHVVLGFRNVSSTASQCVSVRVDSAATWRVTSDEGSSVEIPGATLLADGLALTAPLLASTWVTIERVDP